MSLQINSSHYHPTVPTTIYYFVGIKIFLPFIPIKDRGEYCTYLRISVVSSICQHDILDDMC